MKTCIPDCVTRGRYNVSLAGQLRSDLSTERVTISRTFSRTGIDSSGPFNVKCDRSTVRFNSCVALYVCLTTRAVHFEEVSELFTDVFLLSLSRFIAHRGRPYLILSDNGTNFFSHNIRWYFNPPNAPHRSGIWESAVKSMKRHLSDLRKARNSLLKRFLPSLIVFRQFLIRILQLFELFLIRKRPL